MSAGGGGPAVVRMTTARALAATRGARLSARIRNGRFGGTGGLFAVFLVLTFVNFAAWSLATPLFASPDEPTQVTYAAAAVRGQLVGVTIDGATSPSTAVTVPKVFASGSTYPDCYKFRPTVPASYAPSLTTSTTTEHIGTYVGRTPPLYYLIVGIPSLVFVSKAGIYLMRLMSALLNALLISLALLVVVLWSCRKLLLVGVMVAATPMAWFLGGVVNPSGLEICAAVCLWTAGLVLVFEHPDRAPPGLVAVVAGAAALLSLTRPVSPVWVAITLVVLGLLGGRRALLGAFRNRVARWSAVLVAGCCAFTVCWTKAEHGFDLVPGFPVKRGAAIPHLLATLFAHDGLRLQQMVGMFGWNDTTSPLLTYVVWIGIVGLVLVLASWCAGARRAGTLLLLLGAVVVVPLLMSYVEVRRTGLVIGQGRDWLPIAVGVPLVSVALIDGSEMLTRFRTLAVPVLSAGVAVASIAAFLETLRRYAVGVAGPIDFLAGKWSPPIGLLGAAVGGCACVALLLAAVAVETGKPSLAGLRTAKDSKEQARHGAGRVPAVGPQGADL
ncbi:MAG: DUF2142 domain-containing protein [Nitrososphaerales archaeon]